MLQNCIFWQIGCECVFDETKYFFMSCKCVKTETLRTFFALIDEAQQSHGKLLQFTYHAFCSYSSLHVPITLTQTYRRCFEERQLPSAPFPLKAGSLKWTFAERLCYGTSLTFREPDGKSRGSLGLSRSRSA